MPKLHLIVLTIALTSLVSCGVGDLKAPDAPGPTTTHATTCRVSAGSCTISINGTYTDAFNTTHTISVASWVSSHSSFGTSTYNSITIDNTTKRVIAQNSSSNGYAPNKYSTFDWTIVGGQLYYCQIAYDEDTQEAAEAKAKADESSPSSGGCGGFPWSALN